MKIMIMSDSHDAWQNLSQAIEIANSTECKYIIHAGDFVTPSGLDLFKNFKGRVFMVFGNNEGEKMGFTLKANAIENIKHFGETAEFEIDSLKFFVNHYPIHAQNAALSQKYDVCIHGHDHLYKDETIGKTRLLNPGEIVGSRTGTATVMIFDTKTKKAEKIIIARDQFIV